MTRTSKPTEYVRLTGARVHSTERAVYFLVEQVAGVDVTEPVKHWFPRSQMKSSISKVSIDGADKDMIEVADWICREKELV